MKHKWLFVFLVVVNLIDLHAQYPASDDRNLLRLIEQLLQNKLIDSAFSYTEAYVKEKDISALGVDTFSYVKILHLHCEMLTNQKNRYSESFRLLEKINKNFDAYSRSFDSGELKAVNLQIRNCIELRKYEQANQWVEFVKKHLERLKVTDDVESARSTLLEGILLKHERKYDLSIQKLHKGMNLFKSSKDTTNRDFIQGYFCLADIYKKTGKYNEALRINNEALKRIEALEGNVQFLLGKHHALGGTIYGRLGKADKEIQNYKIALDYHQNSRMKDKTAIGAIYNNMASYYDGHDEYNAAISNYLKAISILEADAGKDARVLFGPYFNLAIVYRNVNDFALAFESLDEAERIFTLNYGEEHPYLLRIKFIESYILISQGNYAESDVIIDEVMHLFQQRNHVNISLWSQLLLSKAHNQRLLGHPDVAIDYLEKYMAFAKTNFAAGNQNNFQVYADFAAIYMDKKEFDLALDYSDRAIKELSPNGELKNIATLHQPLNLIDAHHQRGRIYFAYYEMTNENKYLKHSCAHDEKALQIIRMLLERVDKESTNSFLRSSNRYVFEDIIKHRIKLFEITADTNLLNMVFEVFEINKYNDLLRAILESEAIVDYHVEERLLNEEERIVSDLDKFKKQRKVTVDQAVVDSSELQKTVDSLNYFLRQFELFKSNLKEENLGYYNQKYRSDYATIEDVQSILSGTNSCMVEFFLGDSAVVLMLIDETSVAVQNVKVTKRFLHHIELAAEMFGPSSKQSSSVDSVLAYLFDVLVGDLASRLRNYRDVIIVPDRVLGYIPFEVLQSEEFVDASNKYGYWGFQNTMSYAYSASLYQFQQGNGLGHESNFMGFVADYSTVQMDENSNAANVEIGIRSTQLELPNALEEVTAIQDIVGGKVYKGQESSKFNFLDYAEDASIIHLSMHSVINDSVPLESGLIFAKIDTSENNVLTISELYSLELNADLAVLAACQTGDGKYKHGEGITSLANAFAYAGVTSTVMSLWKVPDKATKKIMVEFYRGLKEGLRKDEALRKAKMVYLDNTIEPQERHPYYWAGFIVQGNTDPIEFASAIVIFPWILGGVTLLGLLALFYFLKKRRLLNAIR